MCVSLYAVAPRRLDVDVYVYAYVHIYLPIFSNFNAHPQVHICIYMSKHTHTHTYIHAYIRPSILPSSLLASWLACLLAYLHVLACLACTQCHKRAPCFQHAHTWYGLFHGRACFRKAAIESSWVVPRKAAPWLWTPTSGGAGKADMLKSSARYTRFACRVKPTTATTNTTTITTTTTNYGYYDCYDHYDYHDYYD